MKSIYTLAILAAVASGAAIPACGSGGSATTAGNGGSGSGSSTTGHGGKGAASASTGKGTGAGGSTGTGFDAGMLDGSERDGDGCGSVALMSKLTPGNIVVVFDQSDSMHQPYKDPDAGAGDGGSVGPKWQVAEDAIVAAFTPDKDILNAGAIFFPTIDTDSGCSLVDPITSSPPQIPIEPGASFVTDFQAHFSAKGWSLILGTPTVIALQKADAALPNPSPFPGKRAVVLVTDGAPTCDTKQADILAPVQDMFSRGIKTYAVGLPGSSTASKLLDSIAQAGGTGSYLSPGDPTSLQQALAQIATETIDQCTITLSPPPPNPNEVYLIVTDKADPNGVVIPQGDGGGDGWTLSSDGMTATLTGAVCTKAKDGGYTSVQFVYGCPTLPT
jgi:hypothetical protein